MLFLLTMTTLKLSGAILFKSKLRHVFIRSAPANYSDGFSVSEAALGIKETEMCKIIRLWPPGVLYFLGRCIIQRIQ